MSPTLPSTKPFSHPARSAPSSTPSALPLLPYPTKPSEFRTTAPKKPPLVRPFPPLSIWPLKWTTATLSIAGYPSPWHIHDFLCSFCNTPHACDPISFLTFCPATQPFRDAFCSTAPPHLLHPLHHWCSQASAFDRRLFFRTLIPLSLHHFLLSLPPQAPGPPPMTILLQHRQRPLTALLLQTISWLHLHPHPQPMNRPILQRPWHHPAFSQSTPTMPPPVPPPPPALPRTLPPMKRPANTSLQDLPPSQRRRQAPTPPTKKRCREFPPPLQRPPKRPHHTP